MYSGVSVEHNGLALALTCIDFRFQSFIRNFLVSKGLENGYDLMTRPGSSKDVDETLIDNIALSQRLHGVKRVLIIHHQNCGAYGDSLISGTSEEIEKHKEDMRANTELLKEKFPKLEFENYFVNLSGEVVKV